MLKAPTLVKKTISVLLLIFRRSLSKSSGLSVALANIMDVISAVSGYVSKMVSSGDTTLGAVSSKMKILLLDSETVRVYGVADSPDQS